MRTIEGEAYKPPADYSTLARSWGLRDSITEAGRFDDLPQTALEMGFRRTEDFPTKRAVWQVYDRPKHEVRNFPDTGTVINSTLAVRENEGELTHAILRTSLEPYTSGEFARDLEAFTKYYVERPRLLGFPSEVLTKGETHVVIFLGGIPVGGAIGYLISGGDFTAAILGALIGETIPASITASLWGLSERHARRQLSALDQYTSGDGARNTLYDERHHEIEVAVQRELYSAIQQEGVNLAPDEFLNKIYGQTPQVLVQKRHAEIERTRYSGLSSSSETGNTLPKLIEITRVLQAA